MLSSSAKQIITSYLHKKYNDHTPYFKWFCGLFLALVHYYRFLYSLLLCRFPVLLSVYLRIHCWSKTSCFVFFQSMVTKSSSFSLVSLSFFPVMPTPPLYHQSMFSSPPLSTQILRSLKWRKQRKIWIFEMYNHFIKIKNMKNDCFCPVIIRGKLTTENDWITFIRLQWAPVLWTWTFDSS